MNGENGLLSCSADDKRQDPLQPEITYYRTEKQMNALFIINQSSGKQNVRATLKDIISDLILDQICSNIDVFYTEKKDDARNRAMELKPGEYDFVVSVGGDGTLNEVVNGLVAGESGIPLAVISSGTVNDFATYMQLPQNSADFCRMINDFKIKKVDVGKVNDQYFVNVLAAGLLTDVAYKVPKNRKAILGKNAYYLECLRELPVQLSRYLNLRFESEEFSSTEDVLVFLVANTKSVGGFPKAAPEASVTDGLLDVLIAKRTNLWRDAPDIILKILQGNHPKHEAIEYFQTGKLVISSVDEADEVVSLDYDGEILEESLPVTITIEPEKLDLLVLEN